MMRENRARSDFSGVAVVCGVACGLVIGKIDTKLHKNSTDKYTRVTRGVNLG